MWKRLTLWNKFRPKPQNGDKGCKNLYIDLSGVEIFDSKNGWVECKRLIRNVSKHWVKINGVGGRCLDCTDDHPLPTNRGRLYARDLKVGDKIYGTHKLPTETKLELDPDMAWFYGAVLCDGCVSSEQVSATFDFKTESDITEHFADILRNKFECDVNVREFHRGKKGDYFEINVKGKNKRSLNAHLISVFGGITKITRHIPLEIFHATLETKLSFIAGMIDADGYIRTNGPRSTEGNLGSINKELAVQQMMLLESAGYKARIRENRYTKDPNKIRYMVSFNPDERLIKHLKSHKKQNKFERAREFDNSDELFELELYSVVPYEEEKYSYDVTTSSDHFDVSGIWSHNCRTYNGADVNFSKSFEYNLKLAADGETDLSKYDDCVSAALKDGRGNIAPNTIILPTAAMECKTGKIKLSDDLIENFMLYLDQLIHEAKDELIEQFEYICSQSEAAAKFMYENRTFVGYIPSEGIRSALRHGTLVIGQIGLAETLNILIGKDHTTSEGMELAKRIENLYKKRCAQFKTEYSLNFGVYYTPKLCGHHVSNYMYKTTLNGLNVINW